MGTQTASKMQHRQFTEAEIAARHSLIISAGICPDCETVLVIPDDQRWPHEECPGCGARYLADFVEGQARLIQSFSVPGRIVRDLLIRLLSATGNGQASP